MKTPSQLNKLAKKIHAQNKNWWVDLKTGEPLRRNEGELLMLVITELAEAVQGMRKDLMDDHLTHRKMEEVEMADAMIRLMDFVGGFKIKLKHHPALPKTIFSRANKSHQILDICDSICMGAGAFSSKAHHLTIACNQIEYYCKVHKLDLWGAVKEKLACNKKRADHKLANRRKAGGKKF